AVDEARRLGHRYVGSEHLLLGLLAEGEGMAATVLGHAGLSLDNARTMTEQVLTGPERRHGDDEDPEQDAYRRALDAFTDRVSNVIALAEAEARRLGHGYVGTEHLLLGLARQDEGVATRVLANLGIQAAQLRSAVEFIV